MSTAPALRVEPADGDRSWRRVLVVFAKEIRDHLRDRRSLVLALIYPLSGPILLGLLVTMAGGGSVGGAGIGKPPPVVGVVRAANAPDLVTWLERAGVVVLPVRGSPMELLASGQVPVILDIGEPPPGRGRLMVRVVADYTKPATLAAAAALTELVNEFGRELARTRLRAAGVEPDLADPLAVEQINLGRRPDVAGFVYALIPALTVFIMFLGAVYLSVDSTVGERERGSWEPLLTAPVHRRELLLGKAGAGLVFTAAAVAFNLLSFGIVLQVVAGGNPGMSPPPPVSAMLLVFLIGTPVMALAVIVQISVGAVARSLKEAQIYLGLLPLLPAFAGMVFAFAPLPTGPGLAAVPVIGQMALFARLVTGETIVWWHALLGAATTTLVATVLFLLAARLFERETLGTSG